MKPLGSRPQKIYSQCRALCLGRLRNGPSHSVLYNNAIMHDFFRNLLHLKISHATFLIKELSLPVDGDTLTLYHRQKCHYLTRYFKRDVSVLLRNSTFCEQTDFIGTRAGQHLLLPLYTVTQLCCVPFHKEI